MKKFEAMTAREEAIAKLEEAIRAVQEQIKSNQEDWKGNVPPDLPITCLQELEKLCALTKNKQAVKELAEDSEVMFLLTDLPFTDKSPTFQKVMKAIRACRWVKSDAE